MGICFTEWRHWPSFVLFMVHRLRCWPNIKDNNVFIRKNNQINQYLEQNFITLSVILNDIRYIVPRYFGKIQDDRRQNWNIYQLSIFFWIFIIKNINKLSFYIFPDLLRSYFSEVFLNMWRSKMAAAKIEIAINYHILVNSLFIIMI